ncbi:C40 family peptidase [Parafilimonas sp.]|uniref:C40 family peptidase n=1 Tax=Parafilimonas sp. TaxID=1969739 RepID=UPI0039E3F58D
MNIRLTQIISLLLILSSCKSLQRTASRSNANASHTASKKSGSRFLNDVSIRPGEKNSNYNYTSSAQSSSKSVNSNSSSFNLEKADWLQIKYAIMTDMPVEQLNNLTLLKQMDHWMGTRYCLGGNDEDCIDCSAFTQTLLRSVYGVDVPRTAKEQFTFATRINDTDLHEGDLVFFKTGRSITHVGMYVGNYKFIHAATSTGVAITDLNDAYWGKKYAGAGRVIH